MSVLTRSALEASPLADLHTIASELGIDGFRRLRKADLVDRIIVQQGGEAPDRSADVEADAPEAPEAEAAEAERTPRRRTTRGGRSRRKDADQDVAGDGAPAEDGPH